MNNIINPANALTLSRFLAAPVMLWLIMKFDASTEANAGWISACAFGLIIVTILTDLFDGMVARYYKVVTDFGKIMDPVADSTFFMTLLLALSASPRFTEHFPIWFPVIVLWREVAMQVLRRYAALRGIVMAAKISGKAKMFIQSIAISLLLAVIAASDNGIYRIDEDQICKLLYWCGVLVVAVNVLSLTEYLKDVPTLLQEPRKDCNG